MLTITTKEEFERQVLQADRRVLVDFWATWCGPCRMMTPVLEQLGAAHADKLLIVKVDVDQASELANQFNIVSVPTFILFEGGKQLARTSGGRSLEDLRRWAGLEV